MAGNSDYDIGKAFQAIENELISSMIRNMERHKAEETKEGYEWEMWQAKQLDSLEKYKKDNRKKYGKKFRDINKKIEAVIRGANEDGQMEQEISILNAIKDGYPGIRKTPSGGSGTFFKVNDRKLDSLIKATTDDMKKAETAILRQANDGYRKAIYNAQVYANTGAGTYEKAVDMATKDMLAAGLNCIKYKNGSRHTLADYADMALRTASKRAYLQGEGTKRQEWQIYTVIVNKRGNPCPKCLPFCGKVFIDDVWSGGPKDGKSPLTGQTYPLMSSAVEAGLYHPRCKDSHTTYFEGISSPPDGKYSREELALIEKENRQEAKKQYAKRQMEKYDRLAKYSLDEDSQRKYAARRDEWENQVGKYADSDIETVVSNEESPTAISSFAPAETLEEAQEYAGQFLQKEFMDKTFKGIADYKGLTLENANAINKALTNIYESIDIEKISGLKVVSPTSKIGKKAFKDGADAIASYDPIQHGIYLNKNVLGSKKKFEEYVKRSDDAWDIVMANRNSLTGAQKELADKYAEAGRSLVDGKTVEGVITHEMGHHVQWNVLDAKTSNFLGSRMSEYAPKISGYANASKGEYIAESFTAYMNGEKDILDSEFVQFLDGKTLAKASDSATIISGARITDLFSDEAKNFAEMYYEEIRHFSTDAKKIAENLGKNESDIQKIKKYLFEDNSQFDEEIGAWRRFDPDCAIAQSWQRLMSGKNIKEHDRTLIEHELLEMEIKKNNPGISHLEAHTLATRTYNYDKEAAEYYGSLEKH